MQWNFVSIFQNGGGKLNLLVNFILIFHGREGTLYIALGIIFASLDVLEIKVDGLECSGETFSFEDE